MEPLALLILLVVFVLLMRKIPAPGEAGRDECFEDRMEFYRLYRRSPKDLGAMPIDTEGRPVAYRVPLKILKAGRRPKIEFSIVEPAVVVGVRVYNDPDGLFDTTELSKNPERPLASVQINFPAARHLMASDVLTMNFGSTNTLPLSVLEKAENEMLAEKGWDPGAWHYNGEDPDA